MVNDEDASLEDVILLIVAAEDERLCVVVVENVVEWINTVVFVAIAVVNVRMVGVALDFLQLFIALPFRTFTTPLCVVSEVGGAIRSIVFERRSLPVSSRRSKCGAPLNSANPKYRHRTTIMTSS